MLVVGLPRLRAHSEESALLGERLLNQALRALQLGADDFIFFDAEDTVVNGGSGRDVAVAIGD